MNAVTNGLSNFAQYATPWLKVIVGVSAAAAYFSLPVLPIVGVGAVGSLVGYGWENLSMESALGSINSINPQDKKIRDVAKRVLKTIPNEQRKTFVEQLNRLNLLPQDLEEGMKLLQKMDSGERETFVTQLAKLNIRQENRLVYAEILKKIPATERSVIINQIIALGNPSMTSEQIEKIAKMLFAMTTEQRNAFIIQVSRQSHQKDSNRFAIIAALHGAENQNGELALSRANQITQEFFNSECRAQDKSTLFEIVNAVMKHYDDSDDQIKSFIESAKSLIGFRTDAQSKLLILEKLAQLNPMRQHAANRFIAWHMGVKERVELLEALKEIPDSALYEVFWLGKNLIKSSMDGFMRASILKHLASIPDDKQRTAYAAQVGAQIGVFNKGVTLNKLLDKFTPTTLPPPPLAKEKMAQEEQLLDFIHSRVASSDPGQRKLHVDHSQLFDANEKPAQPHRLLLEHFWKARRIGAYPVEIDGGEPNFLGKLFTALCHKEQTMLPMRSADDASIGRIPVLDNSAPGALPQAKQIECLRAIGTVFGNAMGGLIRFSKDTTSILFFIK